MVRKGRGATTARGGRGMSTRNAASRPEAEHEFPDGVQLCVSCSKDVGDAAIGCDKCEHWVHGTEMCSGLPQRVIDTIMEYDGRGISFVCTKCRITRESSTSNNAQPLMVELVTQIFQQMKGLCNTVQNLMDQVKTLSSKPPPSSAPAPTAPSLPSKPTQEEYRASIRKEVQEMNEREKRRSSIIVKGLSANSPRDLAQQFSQLTQEVMSVPATLTEVSKIPGHPNIFRAKILDEAARKQVLERSKSLRGTTYANVYISRDLTYAQRAELYARRQARRAEANSQSETTSASPPTSNEPVTSLSGNQGNSPSQ